MGDYMKKCPMCGKETQDNDFFVQFVDDKGRVYSTCGKCHDAIASIAENDENYEQSLEYVDECCQNCTDKEFEDWLVNLIAGQIRNDKEVEYDRETKSTFWISNLKAVNRIIFFIIIIIGIILFSIFKSLNLGMAIAAVAISIVVAVLTVGLSMVFLDMAEDIHRIRKILEKTKRQ